MHAGGDVAGQGTRSPGSDGALPAKGLRLSFLVLVLVLDLYASAWGVTSLGRATRETPVRTEPHPTKGLRLSFPQSCSFSFVLVLDLLMGAGQNERSVTPPRDKITSTIKSA